MMVQDLAVQIIRESTLEITDQVRLGEKGTNPLSDRLWNLGTALFYKCGRKPWTLATARDGVCYVGIADPSLTLRNRHASPPKCSSIVAMALCFWASLDRGIRPTKKSFICRQKQRSGFFAERSKPAATGWFTSQRSFPPRQIGN